MDQILIKYKYMLFACIHDKTGHVRAQPSHSWAVSCWPVKCHGQGRAMPRLVRAWPKTAQRYELGRAALGYCADRPMCQNGSLYGH